MASTVGMRIPNGGLCGWFLNCCVWENAWLNRNSGALRHG
jgi:hypothetical protein